MQKFEPGLIFYNLVRSPQPVVKMIFVFKERPSNCFPVYLSNGTRAADVEERCCGI